MSNSSDARCECGVLKRYADVIPVEFDEQMNEYYLVRNEARTIMRFCFWCGGRLPASKREHLFTKPSETEMSEVRELLRNAASVDDALRILGPADELRDAGGSFSSPGHPFYSRWDQHYIYQTRWKTLRLIIPLVLEGKFHWQYRGHRLDLAQTPE